TVLSAAASGLRRAGAGALVLATNTMHKVAAEIEAGCGLPLLHIADATGAALREAGMRSALFLGTRFSMEDDSIVRQRLLQSFGIETRVPDAAGRTLVHQVIYDELCRGQVNPASREAVVALIAAQRGVDAVILGCTEITLLIDAHCSPLPVFDTTALHAQAAATWILHDSPPDRG
ncbi:MAG: amino acid racemase, partial [Rubrivivax sp.]